MGQGQRKDPYSNFRYRLEIDGIIQAGFSEATIPDITVEPIEYREGDEPNPAAMRKLPGVVKYGNLTLKWGMTDSMDLYEWHRAVTMGTTDRKNISVILMDEEGSDAARWRFAQAWPTKYDAPDLTAKGNDAAIETLEIVHEGMVRED